MTNTMSDMIPKYERRLCSFLVIVQGTRSREMDDATRQKSQRVGVIAPHDKINKAKRRGLTNPSPPPYPQRSNQS